MQNNTNNNMNIPVSTNSEPILNAETSSTTTWPDNNNNKNDLYDNTTNSLTLHKHLNEEIYDNLNVSNPIEASYIIEDDDEDEDVKKFQLQQQALFKSKLDNTNIIITATATEDNSNNNNNNNSNDFLTNKSAGSFGANSSTSLTTMNNRGVINTSSNSSSGKNKFSGASSILFQQQQQLNEQIVSSSTSFNNQVSEEIDDDDSMEHINTIFNLNNNNNNNKVVINEDQELRNYDDNDDDQLGHNEDEFFLISTPSSYIPNNNSLNYEDDDDDDDDQDQTNVIRRHLRHHQHMHQDNENEDEEHDDEDEDEIIYNQQVTGIRYQMQYDLNRLSNIIEEEDFNYEEEDEAKKEEDEEEEKTIAKPENDINNFKEMLILGDQIKDSYASIQNQLNKPCEYKPVMKKRVYQLNGAYMKPAEEENTENKKKSDLKSASSSSFLLSTTRIEPPPPPPPQATTIESSSSDYSMLNYLISRLSEQHKTKLADSSTTSSSSIKMSNNNNNNNVQDDETTKAKINNEFEEFEKHLFEKYALPSIENKYSKEVKYNSENDHLLELNPSKLNDTSYILTRSLYAEHKKVVLDNNNETLLTLDVRHQPQNSSSMNSSPSSSQITTSSPSTKLITALSINEIETRRSIGHDININDNNNALITTTKNNNDSQVKSQQDTDNDDDEGLDSPDEKKIKEEIVLIGEKNDIESLLDNKNNQLFNIILANTNRANQLDEIESNLAKKRIQKIRNSLNNNNSSNSNNNNNNIEIEIEYNNEQDESEKSTSQEYEHGLKEIAKYLVDEITKISVNKLKIDYLNETLNKKYFSNDLLTKHEVLTHLIDSETTTNSSIESLKPPVNVNDNKSREELFDYYTNLEKNLQQIRQEIDNLKREAYDDLAYINDILTDEQSDENTLNDDLVENPIEIDEDDDEMPNYYNNNSKQKRTIQVPYVKSQDDNEEEDEEDNTQYLSQGAASVQSNVTSVNVSSQAYMTPAESWQTLTNLKNTNINNNNSEHTIKLSPHNLMLNFKNTNNNNMGGGGDQTDLDEEDDDVNNLINDSSYVN